eukprot:TRINITY_DN6283_c0_g1_i5.p2 TRINITY_DN6283_c0_g1~~TRINITY_DN6283_c0_g1_i5.p2  ORF type:complete len:167 (+),score=29.54 TRINITY_DN6283_c0_g1_i5:106-606(+)
MEDDNSSGSLYKKEEEVKKRKLERNRKCAKESRKRKKEYVIKLEQQVSQLQEELEYYKEELARYTSVGATPQVKNSCEASKQFHISRDDPAGIQAALSQLWERNGTYSDKRCSQVDEFMENLKCTLIPPLHSIVLSSALHSQGLFCPPGSKKISRPLLFFFKINKK